MFMKRESQGDPRDWQAAPNDPTSAQSPTTSVFTVRTLRERLNDPSASMLDLDDDSRASTASTDDSDHHPQSFLGPNLRFHSRAPWETESDDDPALNDDSHSVLFPSKKAFGFSSSPRPSNARRPSVDSTRSQAKSKQSFETTASQISYPRGALYALAQESLSTSSLGAKQPRSKFWNHSRPDSPNNKAPSSPIAARSNHTPLTPSSQHDPDTRTPSTSHRQPTYAADGFHPYANPDLVSDDRHYSPPQQIHLISRSDSIGTVTDSVAHDTLSRSETRSTLAPVSSVLSVNRDSRNRASTIHGKGISSPILVSNPLRLDSTSHSNEEPDSLHGWGGRGTVPGFSLISLEEARAQRMRSATAQPSIPVSPPLTSAPLTDTLFPNFHDLDRVNDVEIGESSSHNQRSRARSISAGAKAKGALQNIVSVGQPKPDSDVGQGKALKHKKSGFMRLFNSGRGQDKEEKSPPPPVPLLSNAYAALSAPQKVPKGMTHRVPVPDLSPSLRESHLSPEPTSPTVELTATAHTKPFASPKRPIPHLSINTQRQSWDNHTPRVVNDSDFQTRTAPSMDAPHQPWLDIANPQSAPAIVPEFPALKLRPVSTVFSAQFGDHIVLPDSRPSLEPDVSTPGSSTRVFSPVTPGSSTLSDRSSAVDPKSPFTFPISDQSVINALQDQILNSKLAWQRQIWELESQVRELKAEVDDLRKAESEGTFCGNCGRGQRRAKVQSSPHRPPADTQDVRNTSVVNRPRARTGISSRFGGAVS
ncbi:hypothetical protein H0H87_009202 [Tephrocybe sp. NHM501043]|nr:hypothetical protein H0H87_009202 [Tephrocybe sp. NHM501043]